MKGDALIQKSYVADFLDKRQRKNKGEIPSYYVSGGHEAIIEPDLFDSIQEMRRERNDGVRLFTGIRPWASKLICGKCGNYFRIKKRHGHVCWECRDGYKKEGACKNTYIAHSCQFGNCSVIIRILFRYYPDKNCRRICLPVDNTSGCLVSSSA